MVRDSRNCNFISTDKPMLGVNKSNKLKQLTNHYTGGVK
jgi:hypothetical protein